MPTKPIFKYWCPVKAHDKALNTQPERLMKKMTVAKKMAIRRHVITFLNKAKKMAIRRHVITFLNKVV